MHESLCFAIKAYALQTSVAPSKSAVLCCCLLLCLTNYRTDLPYYRSLFLSKSQFVLVYFSSNIFVFYQIHQIQNFLTKHVYPASFTMSDHSNHHSPAANDQALDLTGAQRSDAASSGYADGTADTRITSPSPWGPGSTSDFGLHTGSEQRLTPGGPSISFAPPLSVDDDLSDLFPEIGQSVASNALTMTQEESPTFESVVDEIMRQPLSIDDEPSDLFPEIDQSVASDALTITQQESPTFESVIDEIMRQPLSMDDESAYPFPAIGESMTSDVFKATQQEQQSCFGLSAYDLFHVSFASKPDLGTLSEIHARASASDHLACCMMHRPEEFDSHLEVGRFHYGQAFAAKDGAVILKATNRDSGEIVGCAWLQLHIFHKRNKRVPFCQPGCPLPCCLKQKLYRWVHTQIHQHRQKALRKSGRREYGTLHYCKYR